MLWQFQPTFHSHTVLSSEIEQTPNCAQKLYSVFTQLYFLFYIARCRNFFGFWFFNFKCTCTSRWMNDVIETTVLCSRRHKIKNELCVCSITPMYTNHHIHIIYLCIINSKNVFEVREFRLQHRILAYGECSFPLNALAFGYRLSRYYYTFHRFNSECFIGSAIYFQNTFHLECRKLWLKS